MKKCLSHATRGKQKKKMKQQPRAHQIQCKVFKDLPPLVHMIWQFNPVLSLVRHVIHTRSHTIHRSQRVNGCQCANNTKPHTVVELYDCRNQVKSSLNPSSTHIINAIAQQITDITWEEAKIAPDYCLPFHTIIWVLWMLCDRLVNIMLAQMQPIDSWYVYDAVYLSLSLSPSHLLFLPRSLPIWK